jgi:hypothetical protein
MESYFFFIPVTLGERDSGRKICLKIPNLITFCSSNIAAFSYSILYKFMSSHFAGAFLMFW